MKAPQKTARRVNWAGQAPLITLLVLCVVTALLTSRFLSPLNLTNILVQSSIMAVIAMGMTFVIVGGGFDLSVGSTVALSGCIAGMAMLKFGIFAGVIAGITSGAVVGLANGLVVAILRVNPFIATLGSMVLVRGIVYIVTGGAPVTPPSPSGNSRNTTSVNTAALRSAMVVSRRVSLYSGAKVAQTSAA